MIQISNIKLNLNETEDLLSKKIAKKLRISVNDIKRYEIAKKSLDARKKDQISYVYSLKIELNNEKSILSKIKSNLYTMPSSKKYITPEKGHEILNNPPIIIGTGPAGLMAGYILAKNGYEPILVEQGDMVEERTKIIDDFWKTGKLNEKSNVQFGEGGAGTFSDGKLTTGIKDVRCKEVLKLFVEFGAPKEILYESKPHIGTDILKKVVVNLRNEIIALGGKFLFKTQMTDLILKNNKIAGVKINDDKILYSQIVILAIGHSARETFEMLYDREIQMIQKPFAVGVRIEHPQALINEIQYGQYAKHKSLNAADYKQVFHGIDNSSAHTFCMCPGGQVVAAASENGRLVTNGMSEYSRNMENANSAILVPVDRTTFGTDHVLGGMMFQRRLEEKAFLAGGSNYKAPAQCVGDLINGRASKSGSFVKPSYEPGVKWTSINEYLPERISNTIKEAILSMNKKMPGFAMNEAVLTGVESRSSSPVRVIREPITLESSNCKGLYPCGEGAGYAGGIMSAAVDGIKIADQIILKYK